MHFSYSYSYCHSYSCYDMIIILGSRNNIFIVRCKSLMIASLRMTQRSLELWSFSEMYYLCIRYNDSVWRHPCMTSLETKYRGSSRCAVIYKELQRVCARLFLLAASPAYHPGTIHADAKFTEKIGYLLNKLMTVSDYLLCDEYTLHKRENEVKHIYNIPDNCGMY